MPPAMASATPPRVATRPAWALDRLLVVAGGFGPLVAILLYQGLDLGRVATDPVNAVALAPAVFAALLAWRERAWTYLATGACVALLALAAVAFGGAASLANPLSPNDFSGTLAMLLSAAVAVPASVRGFVRRVRHRAQPPARAGLRRGDGLALLLLASAIVGAVATAQVAAVHGRATAGTTVDGLAPDARVEVSTSGFAFHPGTLEVQRGVLTEIAVRNDDPTLHTLTYAYSGASYSHELLPGATTRFLVKLDQPGTVHFWCVPHSPGMMGDIVVR